MSDNELIDRLIKGDDTANRQFFMENCRPLFTTIIHRVFPYHVDYEEFVNEFYIYLMENDADRLRQFQGRSTIYQWLKTVALRFALLLRKRGVMVDVNTGASPCVVNHLPQDDSWRHARMDVESLLRRMKNERHAYVIRRHIIEGVDEPTLAAEMGVEVSNLYNIKKRAIAALTKVALKDIKQYGRTRN